MVLYVKRMGRPSVVLLREYGGAMGSSLLGLSPCLYFLRIWVDLHQAAKSHRLADRETYSTGEDAITAHRPVLPVLF